MDQGDEDRISRSLHQPMYLLDLGYRKDTGSGEEHWAFKVEGYSGKQYKIHLRSYMGVKCQCPDFSNRQKFCKHVYFIFCRILKKSVWARELADMKPDEVNVFDKFPSFSECVLRLTESRKVPQKHEKQGNQECCVCFEERRDDDSWTCSGCGYEFHQTCMEKHQRYLKRFGFRCPLCNKEWSSLKRSREVVEEGPLSKLAKIVN